MLSVFRNLGYRANRLVPGRTPSRGVSKFQASDQRTIESMGSTISPVSSGAVSSDALVFFGATGDLAYKQIFPALQKMVQREDFNVPIVGVAKAGWTLDQFRARARDSVAQHGGVDEAAFSKLLRLLRYIDGDYQDPATFELLRRELGPSQRPLHYLAIPPALWPKTSASPAGAGCMRNWAPFATSSRTT